MNKMQNISIAEILYEDLGSKVTLTLIDSNKGNFYAKIVCKNIFSYDYISIEDDRDVCAMFICDLNISKKNKLEMVKKKNFDIAKCDVMECYVISAFSGESSIEIVCDNIEISQ